MKKSKEISFPDPWEGWIVKDGIVDYSTDNISYLNARKEYLIKNVLDKNSSKILNELSSYSHRQILAWGCGSGKTTKIKYFCSQTKEPTLVVVKTNEEIIRLVFDIKALNLEQSVCGVYENKDILDCIESDIHYLERFKVVVTNNWRFLTEVSEIFVNYNSGHGVVGRSVIIFDEFPTVYKDFILDQKEFVYQLYKMNKHMLVDIRKQLCQNMGRERILSNLELCSKVLGIESNTNLKLARIMKLMNIYLDFLVLAPKTLIYQDTFVMTNKIDWILRENINSKIIILDATANILFKNSKEWNVHEYEQRKARITKVNYFRMFCSRNSKRSLENHKNDLWKDIFELNNFIKKSNNKKHLIVTWKDTIYINNFPDYVHSHMDKDVQDKVEIIYYNSGECRATNKYKKCDSIIFFGEWFYNSVDSNRISEVLNAPITAESLALSETIQAIFRTQARDSLPIEITFFYTLNEAYINNLDKFDKALLSTIDIDCTDTIIMQHAIRAAELTLNIKTFNKLKEMIELYKINKIPKEILDINIEFSKLKDIFKFRSIRDAIPLRNAMLKFLNLNLVLTR